MAKRGIGTQPRLTPERRPFLVCCVTKATRDRALTSTTAGKGTAEDKTSIELRTGLPSLRRELRSPELVERVLDEDEPEDAAEDRD